MKRKHMSFRLPIDLMSRAKEAADARYQSLTDFIIMAIMDALENN